MSHKTFLLIKVWVTYKNRQLISFFFFFFFFLRLLKIVTNHDDVILSCFGSGLICFYIINHLQCPKISLFSFRVVAKLELHWGECVEILAPFNRSLPQKCTLDQGLESQSRIQLRQSFTSAFSAPAAGDVAGSHAHF